MGNRLTEWITLEEAYNHVLEDVVLPERAKIDLLQKFRVGDIATRAGDVVSMWRGGSRQFTVTNPLPSNAWRAGMIKLLPQENAAEGINWRDEQNEFPFCRLVNISIFAAHLFKLWPEKSPSRAKKGDVSETKTFEWLIADIEKNPKKSKSDRCDEAMRSFKISRRAFNDRVWPDAVKTTGKEELTKAGRKPKLNQRTK